MIIDQSDIGMAGRLRSILLEMARREDELAADEAAARPYWSPTPDMVVARRNAAALLRAEADQFLAVS
ncbi:MULTISPECIES: hypothetical protein [Nocardioides]|uniref:Uncharacterized protein n=1 Tax=Nocardioides vastitatis TaxID=2568655 RepID=A0ABW0ZI69_9ACTN|nr:hypothetical protein [Nocardioides sp.]THI96613.1 hypothetical protein E7Z54_16285 [Nocardioides sp.]